MIRIWCLYDDYFKSYDLFKKIWLVYFNLELEYSGYDLMTNIYSLLNFLISDVTIYIVWLIIFELQT